MTWRNDRHNNQAWPAEHLERMRELVAGGATASEAAAGVNREFDASYTRQAVIGKCHRAGIKLKRSSGGQRGSRAQLVEPAPEELPSATACSLLDLRSDSCRWPIAGGLFCGRPGSHPYCAEHANRSRRSNLNDRR